jgi:hypothetical protein
MSQKNPRNEVPSNGDEVVPGRYMYRPANEPPVRQYWWDGPPVARLVGRASGLSHEFLFDGRNARRTRKCGHCEGALIVWGASSGPAWKRM